MIEKLQQESNETNSKLTEIKAACSKLEDQLAVKNSSVENYQKIIEKLQKDLFCATNNDTDQ